MSAISGIIYLQCLVISDVCLKNVEIGPLLQFSIKLLKRGRLVANKTNDCVVRVVRELADELELEEHGQSRREGIKGSLHR